MPDYTYIQSGYPANNPGASAATVSAPNPGTAIASAPNIDAHSGVQLQQPGSNVSVLSTGQGRDALGRAVDQHNGDMSLLSAYNSTRTTTTPGSDTTPGNSDNTNWAMKQVGGVTADEAKAAGLDLSNYSYDQGTGYFLPLEGTKAQQDRYASDKAAINDAFSTQMLGMDTASQGVVNSIKQLYADRIAAQEDINKRELQGYDTVGIRQGTSRYAPGVQQSILTADENAGLERIQRIAHDEANLLATANENLTSKKFTAFIDNRNELEKLRVEKANTIKDLQTKAINATKDIQTKQAAAKRDQMIADLLGKGVTDTSTIYKTLTASGNISSIKDVQASINNLSPSGDLKGLTGATKDFFVLQQRGMLPDSITALPKGEQLFAYLRQEKAATTAIKNATNPKSPKAGSTVFNPTNDSEITQALTLLNDTTNRNGYAIKGTDGYVDPYVYKQLYTNWIGQNYDPKLFFKYFPTKTYINPSDNANLPSYLRSPVKPPKAAAGTTTGQTDWNKP